jgi:hypothetical protein
MPKKKLTGWDKAAKASRKKRRSIAAHMVASLEAGRATQLDLRPKKRRGRPKKQHKTLSVAEHMAASLASGRATQLDLRKRRGRPKGSKNKHHPKKSGSKKMSAKARMAYARSFRGAGHPMSRAPKHHKGPGRPLKHHAKKTSHRAPKGYNKGRAIARTKLSIKYNTAKLDHLMGVNGTADYRKYGKQLHAMRSKKRKASHRKTR